MIRKIARPMLASAFIIDGVQTVLNPASHKESADSVLKQVRAATPRQYRSFIPKDPETAAQLVGGVKAGAASLFALGKAPRTAAALLSATSVASLAGRNAFWDTDDEDEKARRKAGALTDLALTGGVLLATVDTEGKPDMKWRAQNATRMAKKNVQQALPTQSEAEKAWGKATDWFSDATDQVGDYIDDNKGDWRKATNKAGDAASDFLGDAKKQTSKFLSSAGDWLDDATDSVEGTYKDLKPSKLDQYKAKRKVHGAVDQLQSSLDELGPSGLDKFRAKRKVNKSTKKAQKKAQNAIDDLQDAWENFDASPSWIQKRRWKRKTKKAEHKAKKLVKKAQKKLG